MVRLSYASGFSLIEVMIGLSVMSIMAVAFATLGDNMRKDFKSANRKLDAIELRTNVSRYMSDLNVCGCQLNLHADAFDTSAATRESEVQKIQTTCLSTATTILEVGSLVPGAASGLQIETMKLTEIESLGLPDRYRGRLHVDYKNDGSSFPMRGFDLEIRFRTDSGTPADAKKVVQCDFVGSANGAGSGLTGSCPPAQYMTGVKGGVVQCSGVIVAGNASNGGGGSYSIGSPGPGCAGEFCMTGDFGPCAGESCITNGNSCAGESCVTCGPAPSCTGANCNSNRAARCAAMGF